MRYLQPVLIAVALAAGPFSSAWSHHSRANFELDKQIEFQGVITEFSWRNPHTFAKLEVIAETGEAQELLLELNSISVLTREGWTRETMSVGDKVTVVVNPDHDSNKNLYYANYFVLPSGTMIASAPGTAPNSPPRQRQQVDPTARSEDFSGIWRAEGGRFGPRPGNRQETGSTGAGSPRISLGGQTQAVGLPVTARGQVELDAWDAKDNPWFRCISKTPPWLFSGVGAHKIIRESDERIIIRHEILDVERIIHLGTTEHDASVESSHLGHSIAWFDGDTLVVNTAKFAPAQWGIGNGVSSSKEKHLTERFTLIDDGRRLRLDYIMEDPVYLTEPVSMSVTFSIDPDYPWQDEYGCDQEASSRHLTDQDPM